MCIIILPLSIIPTVDNAKYFLKCLFFLDALKCLTSFRSSKNNIKHLFVNLSVILSCYFDGNGRALLSVTDCVCG